MKLIAQLCVALCGVTALAIASHAWAAKPDCGQDTGHAATGKPIPIGAVTSISLNIGQGDRAARAYFTCVNANGGMPGDQGIQLLTAAEAQDGAAKMKWLGPTTFYTTEFPGAINGKYWNNRLWVTAELGDLDGKGKDNQNWRAIEKTYGGKNDPLDNIAQAGYIAARIVVRAMLGIKGDINRNSVTAAIRNMAPYRTDILCGPWYWGGPNAMQHNPNHISRIVTIENGKWKEVEGCFPNLDPGLAPIIAIEKKLGINKKFDEVYEKAR
ncbi:MAG: ABC transporter substrate-binding protein [Stellaceae bacterium]